MKRRRQARLDRVDWIDGALIQLGEGGIEAVRVEPLAKRLSVTKGSFYWHFADREALLAGLLDHWAARATEPYTDTAEALGSGPGEILRGLFRTILADHAGLAPELAIRDWARHDKRAAGVVLAVDSRRNAYLEDRFVEAGQPVAEARARAALLYGLLVGEVMIRRKETKDERTARIDRALILLTGDR